MLRFAGALAAICFAANAQFTGLATPADGSRVYFATNLRQKNTAQPTWGKLYQVDSSGLQLTEVRDEVEPPLGTSIGVMSNPFAISGASMSADGKVLAVNAVRKCIGPGQFCTRQEYYATTVTSSGQSRDFTGRLQVSANGEWAFGPGSNGYFRQPLFLYHLTDGTEVPLNIPQLDGMLGVGVSTVGRVVADDGTVVYSASNDVVIIRAGQMRRIAPGGYPQQPVMDRTGATIVFPVNDAIRLVDSSDAGSSLLIGDGFAPSLSDDGRTLVYLANRTKPQIHIYHFGGASRQLGFDTAGIAQAILSGDGSTIYAVTLGGRLLKISAATGASQELIPRTPYLTGMGSSLAPGKLTAIPGVGLTDLSFTADAPLPESLNGIQVTIQGVAARISQVTPNAITVLVPPMVTGQASIDVIAPSPSPFEGVHADAFVVQYAPESLTLPDHRTLVAAHQDWHGLVTADDPARPGEVVHTYAVGLGDTSPPIAYGNAAPVNGPLSWLTIPVSCAVGDPFTPLEIPFQGLAPGFAGVYQLDVRMPSQFAGGHFELSCVWGGFGSGGPTLGGTVAITSQ
jgi:uncharacterized protein (TIGR03437 family)